MDYDKAAEGILERSASRKSRPAQPRPEPEPIVAQPEDSLADAFDKGFEAAARAAGECCGCNAYGSKHAENPYG